MTEQWGLTPTNHRKRMQAKDKKDTYKNENRTAEITRLTMTRTNNEKKNSELQKAANNYNLYTVEGERPFYERNNYRIYPDNRDIY